MSALRFVISSIGEGEKKEEISVEFHILVCLRGAVLHAADQPGEGHGAIRFKTVRDETGTAYLCEPSVFRIVVRVVEKG